MRWARFESTPFRAGDGNLRRRLRVAFLWKGPGDSRPRRYRESTRLEDTRANRRLWKPKLRQIERELIVGDFDPMRWFPWKRIHAEEHEPRVETIADFVGPYLEELVGVGERTREQYRLIFEAHVLPSRFAKVRLRELDDGHIKRLIRELQEKSHNGRRLQASTINKILARVRTMTNVAFERGLIPRERGNPMLVVKNLKRPPRRVMPFAPDELLRIFGACEGQQRALYITLAFTGLRPGEALGLCWDRHLDFDAELILVRQQLVDTEISESLKTERSLRDVRMFKPVKNALASLALQNRMRSEFVFCNRHGKPLTEAWQGDNPWRETLENAAVEYRVLYNLRHSYTTLMLRAGKPIQWIAHQLGHAGIKKIDEVYGRWSNPPEEERLELDVLFAAVAALPRSAQPGRELPKFCPSEETPGEAVPENAGFTGTYGSGRAPAGNRTRT